MCKKFTPKTRITLDPVGQFYAATINDKQPGNFYITTYLNEPIVPKVLQVAVNDLITRLPFLSGRLYNGFFWHFHEILSKPPQIVPTEDTSLFDAYYKNGDRNVLRVRYGEQHFTVEAIHSIVDGRGLTKIVRALLVRYFELLGLTVNKDDIVDCFGSLQLDEAEDAYGRFENFKKKYIGPKDIKFENTAYHHEKAKRASTRIISKTFGSEKIKALSQAHNATISEYLLAHIFSTIAEERNACGSRKPITSMLPIDCRNFFSSNTFRSFVLSKIITMPETLDFSEMLRQLRTQFTSIDFDFVQREINSIQKLRRNIKFLPRVLKQWVLKWREYFDGNKLTTVFSNLGRISLPHEIIERVSNLEFVISSTEHMPYSFACITLGDSLTLTITVGVEGNELAEQVLKKIENA
jgi:NRPS condensation-like uncharacterized protein